MNETSEGVRVRLDGILEGVRGPVLSRANPRSVARTMGWDNFGLGVPSWAAEVVGRTLALLAEGKAVRLTSRYGECYWQPLAGGENWLMIPASRAVVYDSDGNVIERLVATLGE